MALEHHRSARDPALAVNEPIDWAAEEQTHTALIARILDANSDLSERISREGVRRECRGDDTEVLFIGAPQPGWTESIDNCVGLYYAPDTLKLRGVEIVSLRGLTLRGRVGTELLVIFNQVATLANTASAHSPDVRERLLEALRSLAAA